MKLLEI